MHHLCGVFLPAVSSSRFCLYCLTISHDLSFVADFDDPLGTDGEACSQIGKKHPHPMKTRLFLLLGILVGLLSMDRAFADEASPRIRPPEELDELFGPIALYPDALIALILPASTVPSDVVMAARYLNSNGDMTKIDDQGWDDSVVDLMHYPDLIKWLDGNLAWTKQAGEAFLAQQDDVMNSVQRLRAKARAAGTLVDTPQQQVVTEGDEISIIPAQPDVIYVPSYDPDVVYVSRPGVVYTDPFLSFGVGYTTGFWLGYDFDWGHHRIWTIDRRDRERYWRERRDWRRPSYPGRTGYGDSHFHQQPWRPPAHSPRAPSPRPPGNNRPRPEVQRPIPYPNGGRDHNRPEGPGHGPDAKSDSSNRGSNNHGLPNSRPETGPKPATVIVPAAPSSRPSSSQQTVPNANARPSPPSSVQTQKGRDDRKSSGHDRSEGTRNPNPQGRVMPLQPAPQTPQPQSQTQPATPPTARFHSRPSTPAPQPRAPAPPSRAHQEEAAYSRQHRTEQPQRQQQARQQQEVRQAREPDRDRHDSRQ